MKTPACQHHRVVGRRFHYLAATKLGLCLVAAAMFAGCTHLGPTTVAVDRFDYSTAIADSWKQQTLLNIVKLRYMDLPVFVDVASIVAGYSMQTGVSVNGIVSSEQAVQGNYGSVGGQAIYTDRPTITYVPMTGEKFLRGLITPIDPKNIFFMLQSGYAADFILGLTVESLNGVRNRSTAGGTVREADPEFVRALELLREVQAAGAFGMRVEEDKAKGSTGVVFFRRDDVPADIAGKGGGNPAVAQAARRSAEVRAHLFAGARGGKRTGREQPLDAADHGGLRQLPGRARGAPEGPQRGRPPSKTPPRRAASNRCGFTAARTSRRARLPPCITAITGSGLTTATCKRSARSRRSCFSSRWRIPAATRSCR